MDRVGRLAGLAAVGMAESGVATSVPAQALGWSPSPSAHGAITWATSLDGGAVFAASCDTTRAPGIRFGMNHYRGDVLRRVDDHTEPVIFEIGLRDGSSWPFRVDLYYFAPDEAWSTPEPLPVAFLGPFARGHTLTLRNSAGAAVVKWSLAGSAAAARVMNERCDY